MMQTTVRSAFLLSLPPQPWDVNLGSEMLFASDISTHRRYKITADGKYFFPLQPEPRTAAQLAATPTIQDATLTSGFGFHLDVEPSQIWRCNAAGTRYVPVTKRLVQLTGPYALQATDDETTFWSTVAVAVTIGTLPFMPRCKFDCPAAGAITLVSANGVLLNGATTTVSRQRSANPTAFDLIPHYGESGSYGVGGA